MIGCRYTMARWVSRLKGLVKNATRLHAGQYNEDRVPAPFTTYGLRSRGKKRSMKVIFIKPSEKSTARVR